ncbi:MAG: hypothetical protein MUF06_11560 [Pirellulaceae bacterium]|nr:hypothetical protein [Pirellulaceae bacterium]
MPSNTKAAGQCPKCGGDALACRYNFFDRGDLQVYSWEHRCGNCGWRETKASRTDEPADKQLPEPNKCPMCGRLGSNDQ